jgi:proteasome accessory factor A
VRRVPKIIGCDVELGNFISGVESSSGSGQAASRLLLRAIDGIPAERTGAIHDAGRENAQDRGRRFLPDNGGCAYIDSDHLELATPETLSAFDHVAYWQAMLRLARRAVHDVNARLPEGLQAHALANCSDGHGHSYGAHVNVLVTREAWNAIVRRKPHYLACLAAFQVSSIVFTGAGKVGSENGRPPADFQLSQRADFMETMLGEQTTYNRPLVNARDEALCGPSGAREGLARLHVIFFDAALCQVATLLRTGTLQIVAAMLETGDVPSQLALDDPLEALQTWSRDPSLAARARLVSGEAVTAVELQQRFLEQARDYEATRGFGGIVPRAGEILALWADTLHKLGERDFDALGRRIDWVLKRQILTRVLTTRPSLTWQSAEIRHLDQLYASVDDTDGLFWAWASGGQLDEVVSEEEVARALDEPPEDTRAWTRAHLLRRAGMTRVTRVDWDRVDVRLDTGRSGYAWTSTSVVHMPSPCGWSRGDTGRLFSPAATLEQIVEALGAVETTAEDDQSSETVSTVAAHRRRWTH